ncbi:Hypothetical predicted protein [Cloeon dipterum]|uniref:Nuclear pore complex protein Nup98-Nup96 n=1 Tax=Cloeon dipterum TaxID=197152 RepID=A0A8S1CY08_9INSE|nr:Hypothetical predicted protein [Cloeon dipterum]
MFNNKTTFGQNPSSSTFGFGGAPTSSTPFGQSAFSKPATANTGFQSTGFGSTGSTLFGGTTAQATSGLFGGTPAPAFGQQPQQQQQSAFSGFNTAGSSSLFGSNSASTFAQPKPAFGAFGASTQSSGLFGSQPAVSTATSSASLFNNQPTGGLFGSSGGFGASTNNNNVIGTPIKFNPLAGTDTMVKNNQTTTISTRHQCITCMKEYENKSLEELRMEDLQAGRKGPQQGGGLFAGSTQQQPQQQSSLFGGATLGQPSTSFANTFGGTTAFGSTAQANTGLFGKPTTFGTPASTASTNFAFGGTNNNNSANPFGGATQKTFGNTGSTLFGAQQPTSLFGATPTTNTGFGFGAQQPQQQQQQQGIGLFGQKQTATPFGMAAPQPVSQPGFGFGQNTATNTQNLFGNKPAMGTGLGTSFGGATSSPFGAKPLGTTPAPAFGSAFGGQQQTNALGGGTSLFGQSKPTGTTPNFGLGQTQQTLAFGGAGLAANNNPFGAKPAAPTSLFGGGVTSAGLFSNPSSAPGTGLFGASTFGTGSTGLTLGQAGSLGLNTAKPFGGFGAPLGGQANAAASQSQAAHQHILALTAYPYGDQPLFRNLPSDKVEELRMKATNPMAQKAAISQSPSFTVSSTATPKLAVKPSGAASSTKSSLFEGLEASSPLVSAGGGSYKHLAAAITPKSSIKLLKIRPDGNTSRGSLTGDTTQGSQSTPVSTFRSATTKFKDILPGGTAASSTPKAATSKASDNANKENEQSDDLNDSLADPRAVRKLALEESQGPLNATDASICISEISDGGEEDGQGEDQMAPHPAGIVMRRAGYYTMPSLSELAKLYEETGKCVVSNFLIGRLNYGNIFFDEQMDVAGLNLDEIVHIRHREVVVYPNDEEKPALGQGLNRKAQVTLDRIFPTNKQTRAPIRDVDTILNMDYDTTLRKACIKMKARFIEYLPNNGSWVFKVDHFSKYGLPDESDDDDDMVIGETSRALPPAEVPVPPKPPVVQAAQQPQVPPKPAHTLSDSHTIFGTSMNFSNAEGMEEDYTEILSPSEHMPRLTGMDTSKIRLMKASLFENEDSFFDEKMAEEEFTFEKPASPGTVRGIAIVPQELEMTLAVPEKEARPSRPHQRPAIVTPKTMPFPVTLPDGLADCALDAALFHGSCAKSSWTARGATITTCDQQVTLTCPYLASNAKKELIEEHLGVQLRLSNLNREDGQIPRCTPQEGRDLLISHCDLVANRRPASAKERMARQVLQLCNTLWGDLSSNPTPAVESYLRRQAVCEWLQTVICEEEAASPMPAESHEARVLKQLAQGKLLECVNACQEVGDHFLSLLVASSGSAAYPKQMVLRQVHDWVSIGVSRHLNEDRLRAWLLCGAGQPVLAQEDGAALNALQSLPWLCALAAHAWYLCSPAASVPDIVAKYESTFQSESPFAAAPVPPGGSEIHLDLRYQLLKLFIQRTYPLEGLLSVETHYPDSPLDFSLSWLLLELLDSLHYTHVSDHCSQSLHLAFAEQLEAIGLWHWSVFVLQHIINPKMRQSAVESVILRHVIPNANVAPKVLSQKEDFLVHKLGIPASLIYSSKATHLKSTDRNVEMAFYHLYAEEWNECYQTVIGHLSADAVINDDFKEVWELLRELQRHSHEIDEWHGHGQIVLNFLNLVEELAALRYTSAEGKLEAISQKVVVTLNHLKIMPCSSPKERLCQSEMAHKLFDLAHAMIVAHRDPRVSASEDYRLLELDKCITHFVYRDNDPVKK